MYPPGRCRRTRLADDFARELTVPPAACTMPAAIARYLCKNEMRPDLILVSAAARTRQTAELVLRELDIPADYRDALYLAEPGKIFAAWCRRVCRNMASVMVVGHNPGIEELAALLAREPVRRKERTRRDVLEEKNFPPPRWRCWNSTSANGATSGPAKASWSISQSGRRICDDRHDREDQSR